LKGGSAFAARRCQRGATAIAKQLGAFQPREKGGEGGGRNWPPRLFIADEWLGKTMRRGCLLRQAWLLERRSEEEERRRGGKSELRENFNNHQLRGRDDGQKPPVHSSPMPIVPATSGVSREGEGEKRKRKEEG